MVVGLILCVGEGKAVLTIVCAIVTIGATLVIMLIAIEVGSRVDKGDIVESNTMKKGTLHKIDQ